MAITAPTLEQLVARELNALADERVLSHIRSLLVVPEAIPGRWDYGNPGEKYVCWYVLKHERSNTGIIYCEEGFGPESPWGLVMLSENEEIYMGMDAGWYGTFMGAYFESFASEDLPE